LHILKADSIRDAETLSILAQEIWEEHYTPIIGAAQVAYMLQNFQSRDKIYEDMTQNHYHYYIAWDGEIPVGYLGIQPQDGELYFSKLYVKKDHRGQGLSRRFLKIAVGFAQSQRLPSIYLTVNKHNEDSIAVYRRLGFATEQAVVSDIGAGYVMDDYIMRMAVPLGSMSPEGVQVDFGGGGEPRYVVVAARSGREWLFVRHESRDTYELPGGHIEPGEIPEDAARRELWEETGATDFELQPICPYRVTAGDRTSAGLLFFAEVKTMEELPGLEIREVIRTRELPAFLTYPAIQPILFRRVRDSVETADWRKKL
jgi:8-oxo-dGTP pyrophosphatase MutT (NUDIX family)/ribosomal protein S18 acetylase RimI-like enzyme